MKHSLVFVVCFMLSCLPPLIAQEAPDIRVASMVLDSALRDARALHPGMRRAEVEKAFENASFVGPSPTQYTWRKLPTIHIEVEYRCKKDAEGRMLFSPDDVIVSVSRPYLDDVSRD